jgi:DNA-binding transcriptional regulator YiaG
MLELLQGTLSDQVMAIVTNRQHGLFPQPGEMTFDYSCPDWAVMCKHVAAVLYGVGSRLDSRPDLLFLLRDVDAQELITAEMALPAASVTSDTLADAQLGTIFGIDLDTATDAPSAPPTLPKKQPRTTRRVVSTTTRQPAYATLDRKTAPATRPAGRAPQAARTGMRRNRSSQPTPPMRRKSAKATTSTLPKRRPTGQSVARLRRQQGLSVAQFAAQLGVSSATVYRWEATPGPLNLQAGPLNALVAWQQQAKKHRMGSNPGHS